MSQPPHDELEEAIEALERLDSDRPSVEVIVKQEKASLIPKVPNTRLAQVVAGLVAAAAIAKMIWEILQL